MNMMSSIRNTPPLTRVVLSNPQLLRVNPSILGFLMDYMSKFRIKKVGDHLILHSHLPPLNSQAYRRFINEHLLGRIDGPSHAQIAITNACPQNCECCYNKDRQGRVMNNVTIKQVARDLKEMGVVWVGLTGGEPLLNKHIVEIANSLAGDCAVKLFTTGCTLTKSMASDLKNAGIFSVSISLDHWIEEKHDRGRRYKGAFKEALKAIETFKALGGIHVGVSSVLSKEMIKNDSTEEFLQFLIGLGVHEAWLSEVKPTVSVYRNEDQIIEEIDRQKLVNLQDRYNMENNITVNYLGHFEGKECFGCNAGKKMVYVDAFGEISPCVFTPMSFGNVHEDSIKKIFHEMNGVFPSGDSCFMNNNFRLLEKYAGDRKVMDKETSMKMLREASFGDLSRFFRIYNDSKGLKAIGRVN